MDFNSRRSVVVCKNGCVASSQPLASQIGIDVLKKGGNAADAAVAMAATLNLVEPCSTGVGGDAFSLFYDSKTRQIKAINGSGRSPQRLDLSYLASKGFGKDQKVPDRSALNVTTPGACALYNQVHFSQPSHQVSYRWVDLVEKFGQLSLHEVLSPTISLARDGFPVSGPVISTAWADNVDCLLKDGNLHGRDLLVQDDESGTLRAPRHGEVFRNPKLADVLSTIADQGKGGFYQGWIADNVVKVVQKMDGVLTHEDMANHQNTFEDPISIEFQGYRLWETQPNSQGIVALMTLSILKNFDLSIYEHNSCDYLHLLIEATRLSFEDAGKFCADPDFAEVPIDQLISDDYGRARSKLICLKKAGSCYFPGNPFCLNSDTVYLTTADCHGNLCSFINSNYMNFGTGIVPCGCGFTLQNRARTFSLISSSKNCVEGNKRPYHTIIPAMLSSADHEVVMSFGVMGGFMQPQGHVQVLLNMLLFGMNPQQALDAPRYLVGDLATSISSAQVNLESGISPQTADQLRARGHVVCDDVGGEKRAMFGRGQIIATRRFWDRNSGDDFEKVFWAASDPRSDGCAIGY